jgi:hypothetical protein
MTKWVIFIRWRRVGEVWANDSAEARRMWAERTGVDPGSVSAVEFHQYYEIE